MTYEEFLDRVATEYVRNPEEIRDENSSNSEMFVADLGDFPDKVIYHRKSKRWEVAYVRLSVKEPLD
jgi:hypothetical protein